MDRCSNALTEVNPLHMKEEMLGSGNSSVVVVER